ncbi:hypothetical protein BO71DRAFT_476281 [Aspergillus ellipticus CBS 707.79]|uniref:Uncharacterized protein n=1 Tax=Aspergillus ellipticus CBS 707.79 TaxID=1448320 RepID=A0A319DAH4_9EURO|nr:hypothetical protein BO71DRAFT_476281 [Aspergillus ellipticus CBS 707.79]
MPPSPLGQLDILPQELRLLIWEDLLTARSLAILRTSQAIYREITERLYDTFDIHISPIFEDPWLKISSRRLRVSWFINERDCVAHLRLARIPYSKVKLVVHIYAPDPKDPGQLILLWQKIDKFSEILNRADDARDENEDLEGSYWNTLMCPTGIQVDINIVFLPFCRMSNVKSLQVIPDTRNMNEVADRGFVNYACDFILDDGLTTSNDKAFSRHPQYRDI